MLRAATGGRAGPAVPTKASQGGAAVQVADEVVRQLASEGRSAANPDALPELLAGFLARYAPVMTSWDVGLARTR